MKSGINIVIYLYIFVCVALLLFNVLYITRTKGRTRAQARREGKWAGRVTEEVAYLGAGGEVRPAHRALLERKLTHIDELGAYHRAVEPRLGEAGMQDYLDACHDTFQALAAQYRRRGAMERAFLARLIALYHPDRGRAHDQLAELLLAFLDDSTVYCRENVLGALCALGNGGGVEHALARFQAEGWYHHPRLLSDGLTTFAGDREALAVRLWTAAAGWSEPLQVAVVQFATNLSGGMGETFLKALEADETLPETRFALIRYFQRWPHPAAAPTLRGLVNEGRDAGGPAIAACAALAKYPGGETMDTLKAALRSRNWYVRRNAASSLVVLGVEREDLAALERTGDRYATEMLAYMARMQTEEGVHAG